MTKLLVFPFGAIMLLPACFRPPPSPSSPPPSPSAAPAAAAQAQPQLPTLTIRSVPDAAAGLDPEHDVWAGAPALNVPVQPQIITTPKQTMITVTSVDVQAIIDGKVVAFRLRWRDMTRDQSYEQDLFPDGCAVQFPLDRDAAFMMGHKGARVHILHWKALWQRDIDEGFQDVQDLHPNFFIDHYWFAQRGWPHAVPAAFADERSHQWFPAREAGNPMSIWNRKEPVQELLAEGFGTLTAHDKSTARGKGIWQNGGWSVVILRELKTDDPLDYPFDTGQALVGFAVWDGMADNVGARKHHSLWVPFRRETP